MGKRSTAYWEKRFLEIEKASNSYGMQTFRQIESTFDTAQREIQNQIESWYGRYAKNNNITMAEARKQLSTRELKEFRWDVDEYIKYGRENELNQMWMKELENASARVHVSRLEALKIRTQHAAEVAFGNELDQIDAMARKVFTEDYYHTIFEVQKGFGMGWEIGQIDARKLETLISKPWAADGKNFSQRIWGQRSQLVSELHTQLTRTLVLGKAPDDAIREISKKFNTTKNQAGRLVMTEQAYFHSVAQKDAFNDLDVEEFEVVATLDSHTSEICQEMDGKHFPMKDYQPGVTAPPFHVWCRSVTVPWFEDNFTGERAARDADGNTYYVPDSMTYEDWKKSMVDGDTDGLTVTNKNVKEVKKAIKLETDMFPSSFTATKAEAKNTQAIVDYINDCEDANPDVVELYSKMGKMENIESQGIEWAIKHNDKSEVKYWYNYKDELVKAHISYPKLTLDDVTGQMNTTLHEQMHLMDMYLRKNQNGSGWFSQCDDALEKFFTDIDVDDVKMSPKVKKLFSDFSDEYNEITNQASKARRLEYTNIRDLHQNRLIDYKEYKKRINQADKIYDEINSWGTRNAAGGGVDTLQDIYDALSGGKFRDTGAVLYGHGGKYYRSISSRCSETLANYGALSITRPELIGLLREDYPELVDILDELVQNMLKKVGN